MNRPNRTLEVFSLSALDLFASALGAFIIITILLFPYYQKKIKAEQTLQQINQELSLARIEAVNAQRKAAQAKKKAAKLKSDPVKVAREKKLLQQSKSASDKLKKKLAALNKQAQRRVPFALLGLSSKSNSFVLVIDMSSSMHQYKNIMLKAVEKIISPMNDATSLAIIGYQAYGINSVELHTWPKGSKNKVKALDRQAKASAYSFIRGLPAKFGGGTPTLGALNAALDYDAKSIILLSDGEPHNPADKIIRQITAKNKGKKEIHTVGIGDYVKNKNLVRFLNRLAAKNKGNFVGAAR